jgi:hypothetical protein
MWSEIKRGPRKVVAGEKKFKVPASLHECSHACWKDIEVIRADQGRWGASGLLVVLLEGGGAMYDNPEGFRDFVSQNLAFLPQSFQRYL